MPENSFNYDVYPEYAHHFDDGEGQFKSLSEAIAFAEKERQRDPTKHLWIMESRCAYDTKEHC